MAEIGEALGLSDKQVERSLSLRGMSTVSLSAAPPGNLARQGKATEVPFPWQNATSLASEKMSVPLLTVCLQRSLLFSARLTAFSA